nr:MAG TPA: hypothetical protein [Siphoviridae sp. ctEfY6]
MWGNFNLSSNHINHSGLGVELIYKKELNNASLVIKNVFNSNPPFANAYYFFVQLCIFLLNDWVIC